MAGSFRSSVWDPSLIISQIICMQAAYYVCLSLWIVLLDLILKHDISLSQIFSFESFQLSYGKLVLIAYMLNALTGSVSLWYIVKRTKQCLDFTLTVHLFHFVICCAYNHRLPASLSWWLSNIVVIVIMTVSGEFLCMRSELREIPLGTNNKADL